MKNSSMVLAVFLAGLSVISYGGQSRADGQSSTDEPVNGTAGPRCPELTRDTCQPPRTEQVEQETASQESGAAASQDSELPDVAGKWDLTIGGREGEHAHSRKFERK